MADDDDGGDWMTTPHSSSREACSGPIAVRRIRVPLHRKTRTRVNPTDTRELADDDVTPVYQLSASPSQHTTTTTTTRSFHGHSTLFWTRRLAIATLSLVLLLALPPSTSAVNKAYLNQWAVEIEGADDADADKMAASYGFKNLGRIIPDEHFFLFESRSVRAHSRRKTRSSQTSSISHDRKVHWMQQQVAKKRVKRGYRPKRQEHDSSNDVYEPDQWRVSASIQGANAKSAYVITNQNAVLTSYKPNDPHWSEMWYINRGRSGLDHNVKTAWDLGYTGKGIVVTILDDGLEVTHPDIQPNYDPEASFDVNDRDDDPSPRYDYTDENRHGTRCAGEVAAIFNNSLCIVGIAYNANIGGGIRMLDGDVTDAVEAASLSHNPNHVDIYSASWGPDDDGRTVDGPARLAKNAFEKGILKGRNGKGSIFVWASGNGGKDADSCNCDGYTNSIHTLSISSATEKGNVPWYSEACSSTLATTYSSGATGERMIVTTDLHHSCTGSHTGTSASAPLAAGIIALALEANKQLTWRDMQHIVVRTARPEHLRAPDWIINGVGRNVSHSFGFGLMDAGAMVRLAKNWTNVPPQKQCRASYPGRYKTIPHGSRLNLQLYTDGCASTENQVNYLEHVQAVITLRAPKRGDVSIYLISPAGTRSTLLAKRVRDTNPNGFREWAFMTTHNWGEFASGLWTLEIDNDGWDANPRFHRSGGVSEPVVLISTEVFLYGFYYPSRDIVTNNNSTATDAEMINWDLVLYGTDTSVGPSGGPHHHELVVSAATAAASTLPTPTIAMKLILICVVFAYEFLPVCR